jgi:hypothetical protein
VILTEKKDLKLHLLSVKLNDLSKFLILINRLYSENMILDDEKRLMKNIAISDPDKIRPALKYFHREHNLFGFRDRIRGHL